MQKVKGVCFYKIDIFTEKVWGATADRIECGNTTEENCSYKKDTADNTKHYLLDFVFKLQNCHLS